VFWLACFIFQNAFSYSTSAPIFIRSVFDLTLFDTFFVFVLVFCWEKLPENYKTTQRRFSQIRILFFRYIIPKRIYTFILIRSVLEVYQCISLCILRNNHMHTVHVLGIDIYLLWQMTVSSTFDIDSICIYNVLCRCFRID